MSKGMSISISTRTWWKTGTAYQVWPTSFLDSNGDGIGDIPGLITKLDYLHSLGVDYIWLSPMYASPRKDMGYDISNYEDVDPTYGTLADMDALISGLHSRGMRIIMDLVVNHTSDQHQWFLESQKSRDNPYSDYYIWHDPVELPDGTHGPPSNWRAVFGGSTWKYFPSRNQYMFHAFLDSMPDLNWESSTTRFAIYNSAIKFWLDKGIDGFRVDALNLYCKDRTFPEALVNDPLDTYHFAKPEHWINGPKMHDWLREQRQFIASHYPDREIVLVGELAFSGPEIIKVYIDPAHRELDMIFDFELQNYGDAQLPMHERDDAVTLAMLRRGFGKPQKVIKDGTGWSTVWLENHDNQRSLTRFGSKLPEHKMQSAKLLAVLLTTLSGSLFLYQGQEIGMEGIPKHWPRSDLQDPYFINYLDEMDSKYPNDAEMQCKAQKAFSMSGRDHARTPVQWSASPPNAGFTSGQPWMRINENYKDGINIEQQEQDANSVLSFWREAIKVRKAHIDLTVYSHTYWVDEHNTTVLSFVKKSDEGDDAGRRCLLVCLNFLDQEAQEPDAAGCLAEAYGRSTRASKIEVILSNQPNKKEDRDGIRTLAPWEAVVHLVSLE